MIQYLFLNKRLYQKLTKAMSKNCIIDRYAPQLELTRHVHS